MGGQEHAHLVPAEHAVAALGLVVAQTHGAAVGIGVVGQDQVGRGLAGDGEREVHRARLLGVREGHGREVGVGVALERYDDERGEPARLEDGLSHVPPDAVHRRVDDAQVALHRRVDEAGDAVHVPGQDVVAEHAPALAPGDGGQPPDGVDVRGDLGVRGRHDLRADPEVDLVAVVLRRVVRGGHHDPAGAAQGADRVREHGGRQRPGEDDRAEPRPGQHLRGVPREHVGLVPGVVADDDGAAAALPEVGSEPRRRTDHDGPVHPVGAGAELAAQAGGAELQPPVEPVRQLLDVVGDQQRLELAPGVRVRVLGQPLAGAGKEVSAHGCSLVGLMAAYRSPRSGNWRTFPIRPGPRIGGGVGAVAGAGGGSAGWVKEPPTYACSGSSGSCSRVTALITRA